MSAYLLDWCVQEEHVATMCRCYSEWEAVVFLQEVEEERAAADAELAKVLKDLGLGNADDKD